MLCALLRPPFALFNGIQGLLTSRAARRPASIVIIKPCCLGDLLMTTPLLEVIRRAYPHASVIYAAGTWSKVIAEHHPGVDLVIDSGSVGIAGRYGLRGYLRLAGELRRHHFDMAFVLDRSPLLTLLPWFAGIPRRIGPDSLGRGFSLTDRVAVPQSPTRLRHQAAIYLELARAIGLRVGSPRMRFEPTQRERVLVRQPTRMRIALFTGGGSNPGMELTAKRWPLARYRELAQRLIAELDAQLLLVGGPGDVALNQELVEGLEYAPGAIIDLTARTSFGEMAAQLEACALFIGNDSSPMHLAAALAIPVIAIFGPTSPQEYGPYPLDDPAHIALWHPPDPGGRPCFFLGSMRPCTQCTCLPAITVEEVWQAVRRLIPSNHTNGVKQ